MTRALLCVSVTGDTTADLRRERDRTRGADLIELRLDGVRDLDVDGALTGRRTPVIVTCRPRWEGGRFDGSETDRRTILSRALAQGAEYVDVEWRAGFDDVVRARGGRGVVVSRHDLADVPLDLSDSVRAMRASGAEVVKVAVQARRLRDLVPLWRLGHDASLTGAIVLIAMGTAGWASRILAAHFGSRWTYAGAGLAPGQIGEARLLDEFRFRSVSPRTAVYAVVGSPVAHSVSPAMHNAAFAAAGLDAVYVPLEPDSADDFLVFADAVGVEGASVTAPFKVDFAGRILEMDALSQRVGAVNTLRRRDGRWEATNTDVAGFLAPLRHRRWLRGARASVLGAGGAARAAAVALAGQGARVTVHARRQEQARGVAGLIGGAAEPLPPAPGSWDVLVNATPVGSFPDVSASPIPVSDLTGALVYDLVYNPPDTRLLRDAAAAGCETVGGLEMLVAQATLQFAWWTGQTVPDAIFRDAALRRLTDASAICE